MNRVMMAVLMLVGAVWPGAALAQGGMKDALKAVPADAVMFVAIPSVKELDAHIGQVIKDLGLEEAAGLPSNSLLAFVKTQAPFLEGIEENGAVHVIIMPAPTLPELSMKQAMSLPVKDPRAFITGLEGQEQEGGMWTVTLMGQPMHAAIRNNAVLLGQYPDVLKEILASTTTMEGKLSGPVMDAIAELDFAIWVDGGTIGPQAKPMVNMLMAMSQQPSATALDQKAMEMNRKTLDRFMDGLDMFAMGAQVSEHGVAVRGAVTCKPGTELAKQMHFTPTSGPMLHGLPADKFVFAFGQMASSQQMEVMAEQIEDVLGMLGSMEGVDEALAGELKSQVQRWTQMTPSYRAEIVGLRPGPMGLIGVNAIVDTSDSQAWIDLAGKVFDNAKKLAAKYNEASEAPDEEVQKMLEALTFTPEAETIGETSVTHVQLDMAKMEDLDADDMEDVLRIIGKEGLLFRLAPAGPKQVVMAFGGGSERFEKLLAAAASKDAPLADHAGIAKVRAHLPASRASVGYLSFDEGMDLVQNILDAVDEERLPVHVGRLEAPLAMASTGGDNWARFDFFLPREVMLAGKNVVMTMMGAARPTPAATPGAAEVPEEEVPQE